MANVNSWELEIPSSIPASKVFDGFVVGFFDFLDSHVFPASLGVTFTNLQGDGGVGTIKLMSFEDDKLPSVKYKIKELDLENFTYNMAVIEGEDDEQYELTLSEMKVIPSVDGGCTFVQKTTEYKGTDEDETESHKEQLTQWFKTFERTITQDSNDD
uniref:probable intracellular pathogenesis-related protein T1 n=1 Tax=Erigeron canadensis TaxID=72917 RepID=UPI001CB89EDD|nr:probable intracellular pathogenesis-related protein T1 [Erigeron canadensis]